MGMSSALGLERGPTNFTDAYDHAIGLVDSSTPRNEAVVSGDASLDVISVADGGEGSQMNRQWTRPHLRQELARRKYAKWQEEAGEDSVPRTSLESNDDSPEDSDASKKAPKRGTWGTQGRLRDMVPFKSKKKTTKASVKDMTFIDVLYENQRGLFLCGIPFYSANSLLNFDPSGWQTSTFQDSPVNITNAQVPDPSWAWDWRSWYVDMSHDVDEEGWEYSFSFSPNFAWHGNHPWFHSFCRRRRWLRKRVRIYARFNEKQDDRDFPNGHKLAPDYFTIHPSRQVRSRSTSGDRSATRRSSTVAGFGAAGDDVENLDDIPNVSTLMQAVRHARVDREKIGAVKQFLDQGGDELFFLADNIPLIMDDFIYQTSREQLQTSLLQFLRDAIEDRDSAKDENSSDKQDSKARRVDNLLQTIDAAGVPAPDRGYLSNLKARASGKEEIPLDQSRGDYAKTGPHIAFRDTIAEHIEQEGVSGDEFKGISKDAEISVEPGIRRPNTGSVDTTEQTEGKKLDKGKEKE